ncbi:MAG: hypothetical protein JWP59_1824 [Massilia sp.]|nr:hypothetical protein [Massilia sp.]
MNQVADPPHADTARLMQAAARLEQPLGALAEAMDEVERVAIQIGHSTYMQQVVAERARYQRLRTLTQPESVLADSLATPGCVHQLMQLLAPSLVFPAATPMQIDFSGEALHHARRMAELHKENLRKMIAIEARRLELDTAPAEEGKCSSADDEPPLEAQLDAAVPKRP